MDTKELLELYKIILEEYRFQVRLNWDRLRYFLTLNIGITAIGFGFLRLGDNDWLLLAPLCAFSGSIILSWLGIKATEKGHQYYREIATQKARIEDALALDRIRVGEREFNLAIESTEGMKRHRRELYGQAEAPKDMIRHGTVLYRFIQGFYVLMGVNILGIVTALVLAV